MQINRVLKEKLKRAFSSVLPVTIIVLVASVFLVPMPVGNVMMFLVGAGLLILGMGFFTTGVEMAMQPMGEGIGVFLTKIYGGKGIKIIIVIIISFAMGLMITIAEPDLYVLAEQIPSIPSSRIISTVALGVGVLLVLAVLRSLFRVRLSILLMILYAIIFGITFFTQKEFVPVAFESGAIATGPIVVPFILAIGLGLASIRSDKDSVDDSFGMLALVITGPIFAMLILGVFFRPEQTELEKAVILNAENSREVFTHFAKEMPHYLEETGKAMGYIVACFVVFQLVSRRFHKHQLGRIAVGFIYTLLGLVFFLTGVNVGFMPVATIIGSELASSPISWILIPLGALIGYFLTYAEPDVYILNKQIEDVTEGAISQKTMYRGLAVGMALAMALTMTRVLFAIPLLYILIPGYVTAIALSFFVPKLFSGIAFDSGTVLSGPISVTFLLPLVLGVAEGAGRDIMLYAIGVVAIIAMTPLVVVQVMGLVYQVKTRQADTLTEAEVDAISSVAKGEIIDWGGITVYKDYRNG